MIVFVCAELNMANKTVISNMVMRLQIWIIDIYSTYVLHKHKDASFHLSGWLFPLAKFPKKKKLPGNYIFRVAFFICDWIIFLIPKTAAGS
jgi:hypothetical protein